MLDALIFPHTHTQIAVILVDLYSQFQFIVLFFFWLFHISFNGYRLISFIFFRNEKHSRRQNEKQHATIIISMCAIDRVPNDFKKNTTKKMKLTKNKQSATKTIKNLWWTKVIGRFSTLHLPVFVGQTFVSAPANHEHTYKKTEKNNLQKCTIWSIEWKKKNKKKGKRKIRLFYFRNKQTIFTSRKYKLLKVKINVDGCAWVWIAFTISLMNILFSFV